MEEPYFPKLLLYRISFFALWCFGLQSGVAATDVIRQGQRISVSDTIVSAGGIFELGFFNPGNSSNYYVGIWYKNVRARTIVWVANRDFPFTAAGVLTVSGDGNLVISISNQAQVTFTITNTTTNLNTSAVLLDSGNLILRDQNSDVLWQSFDFPTHVYLPGMKLGIYNRGRSSWSLVSWRNSEDPGTGEFSLRIDADQPSQFLIVKGSQRYWASGFWNGEIFNSVPEMRLNYIFNYSYVSNDDEIYFTYSLYSPSIISHLVMDISGQIKQRTWLDSSKQWNIFWAQPRVQCDVYAICGAFGLCDNRFSEFCQCLRGFEPRSPQDWLRGDRSGGCSRKVQLQCENGTGVNGGDDKFLKVPVSNFPTNGRIFVVSNAKECNSACFSNCSCSAFSYNGSRGCSVWNGDLFNLQQNGSSVGTIYLKLAASELAGSGKKRPLLIIIPLVAALALLGFISYIAYHCRHKFKRKGNIGSGHDILLFDLGISSATTKNKLLNGKEVELGESNNPSLPLFNFSSISAATDNFSATNKLGEGGFGPVYKGTLLRGQNIAVKRLSKRSAQGLEELKNEVLLIAKLQHRNLVKLLGCCLENEEKILIYEYMPNKSLDSFLFDLAKRGHLDWKTRVQIIEGIAQGLLYLHQYSRLRIIHRDLKASNILLDADMNPKISDFGMARIFGGNELEANTNRIVGTYGYMPPEYALEGLFSIKSDVFSFGVLLLEILSGKKNTGFYNSDSLNLIGYAWDLWMSNKALDLMDLELYDELSKHMGLRYVNVALLCVQEIAADRPTMVEVVSILTNETSVLSSPKQPAFSNVRGVATPTNIPEICSVNDATVSLLQAR